MVQLAFYCSVKLHFCRQCASLYGGGTFSGALYGCALSNQLRNHQCARAWCSTLSNCVLTANAAAVVRGLFEPP